MKTPSLTAAPPHSRSEHAGPNSDSAQTGEHHYNLSRERIRQLQEQAIGKIRKQVPVRRSTYCGSLARRDSSEGWRIDAAQRNGRS